MYKQSEGTLKGFQDLKIFYQKWEPPQSRGTLIITHGHGEHSDCYMRVVDAVAPLNLTVYAWDWRGHGRSEGSRGYAQHFSDFEHDFERFMHAIGSPKDPLFLLSHSMGGLIQLKSLLTHPQWKVKAQILSAPMLGLSMPVPAIKEMGSKVLHRILPKVTLDTGITYAMVTQDNEVVKEFEKDPLRHSLISAGVFLGSLQAIDFVLARADKISVPTLIQVPKVDPVVSTPASTSYFDRLKCQKTLLVYANRQHEVYNDIGRDEPLSDIKKFIEPFL